MHSIDNGQTVLKKMLYISKVYEMSYEVNDKVRLLRNWTNPGTVVALAIMKVSASTYRTKYCVRDDRYPDQYALCTSGDMVLEKDYREISAAAAATGASLPMHKPPLSQDSVDKLLRDWAYLGGSQNEG
jgi:hypothetical protein